MAKQKIVWAPRALAQFEAICDYIAGDSQHYAAIFAQRINKIITSIPLFPKAGRIVPEYDDVQLRERIYENYRIVYRTKHFETKAVEIVAICHAAKPLDNL